MSEPTAEAPADRALGALETLLQLLDDAGTRLERARQHMRESLGRMRTGGQPSVLSVAKAEVEAGLVAFRAAVDDALWRVLTPLGEPQAVPTANVGQLELCCLGGFEVRLDGAEVDQWPRRKAQLLLVALMLYPRGLRAEELAELFDEGSAGAANIRVYARALRRALSPDPDVGERFLLLEAQRYRLNPEAIAFCDVQAFEQAALEGDRLAASNPAAAASAYERALAHYRGNLVDDAGFLKHFTAEREKYRRQAIAVLGWLGEHHRRHGDRTALEACLQRAAALAPCDEDAYLALVRHHHALGQPDKARQAYWDCRKALKAYLGLAPSDDFEQACQEAAEGAARRIG